MEKFETLWGRIEVENGTLCIVIDDYELPYVWVDLCGEDTAKFAAFLNKTLGEQNGRWRNET